MGKTFVCGDLHGGYKALIQCLKRSQFDKEKDTLIQLGDVADGWPETPQCIEELLTIKNLIQIKGNHDHWLDLWLRYGQRPAVWVSQGGKATIDAYLRHPELIEKHLNYWYKKPTHYTDEQNRFYCHGGFNPELDINKQSQDVIMWDRKLAYLTVEKGVEVRKYTHVFLGHTTVNIFKGIPKNVPFTNGNVTLLDTGGGYEGVLTIMNVDTFEYFQSDKVSHLYT